MDADKIVKNYNLFLIRVYLRSSAAKNSYSVISVVKVLFPGALHHRHIAWRGIDIGNGQTHLFADGRLVRNSGYWRFAWFEAFP